MLNPWVFVGIGACGGGDDRTIDITYDACAPLALVVPADLEPEQAMAVETAIDLWRARGVPALSVGTANAPTTIELAFEPASLAFRGLYDDENGVIYINRDLAGEPIAIVIAHELGHAFGLEHVDGVSVMRSGNITVAPTEGDQAALETLWGRCAP